MSTLDIRFKTHLKCGISSTQANMLVFPPTAPSFLKKINNNKNKYIIENKLISLCSY